jgi:hypothetical protein
MSRQYRLVIALAALSVTPTIALAQADEARAVAGGGISVPGWTGRIDANEASKGQKLENSKLSAAIAKDATVLQVTTGPAVVYWHPENRATGNYTVKATFTEPKYMNLMGHPHPYGLFIAGNDMGTDQQSLLYCAAYGNGSFIVRGFGPEPFRMNGGRGETNDAVRKAAGQGPPVTQVIALSVKSSKV